MQDYRHILFATDFSQDNRQVAQRALDIVRRYQAKLTVVHIIEFTYLNMTGELALPPQYDIAEQLEKNARQAMAELMKTVDITGAIQIIESGVPKYDIPRIAQEQRVDLIVLGSHGRHGLARLLGSTADGVIHNTGCDVLAVRIADE